tara:strand:+ start:279 stop:566 length:288 start_codon:yes stop_codon:yes gene_type:complete
MAKKRTMNELRQTKEYYVHKEKILEPEELDHEEYEFALRTITTAIVDRIDIDELVREEMMNQGYCPDWVNEDQLFLLMDDIVKHVIINLQNDFTN